MLSGLVNAKLFGYWLINCRRGGIDPRAWDVNSKIGCEEVLGQSCKMCAADAAAGFILP
jgi:hypothetical protein